MPHPPPSDPPQGLGAIDAHTRDSLLRLMAEGVPAGIAYYEDGTLCCRFANTHYATAFGHTPTSILGMTARQVIGETAWLEMQPYIQRCIAGEQVRYIQQQSADPAQVIEVHLMPHRDGGRQFGAFVLGMDITHHWLAERAVRESSERMRKFSAATAEAIVFHTNGKITDGNEALERLFGWSLAEMLGRNLLDYISPEYHQIVREYAASNREDPYEIACVHRDGHHIPVEAVAKTMPIDGKDYRIVVVRDITARKQAQEHVAFMAMHDTLTQLPNRRHLMDQLELALARAHRTGGSVALLFIDLDHFKTVNDSLGHHAGDELLCELARRLRHGVRKGDLVARFGGDEFVVLLPDAASPGDAAAVADKLLASLGAPCTVQGTSVSLAASIGISLFPCDGGSADELLRRADTAMYQAKDSGRGHRQFYQGALDGPAPLHALQLEHELREAVARQQFVLHYQPQIWLATGALAGLEALVRWQHPTRGLLGPHEFIAFAEARGLISSIGRWVLREACRQLKAWHDAGLPRVPVAVNLSALELRQRDVVADITEVLHDTGLAPGFLEIEITESALMHHTGHAQGTLAALREMGVGVSIDDFGTGYSSLAYLKRYPVDRLKIDRSFIADTPHSADDVAMVTAIVQMGRSLHLPTVAEGVETPEQMALLRDLGCGLAQGWGIARPMDAERARAWMLSKP
ncbi:MAG: EAL domain-containing protein [Acidovorax sp.]